MLYSTLKHMHCTVHILCCVLYSVQYVYTNKMICYQFDQKMFKNIWTPVRGNWVSTTDVGEMYVYSILQYIVQELMLYRRWERLQLQTSSSKSVQTVQTNWKRGSMPFRRIQKNVNFLNVFFISVKIHHVSIVYNVAVY